MALFCYAKLIYSTNIIILIMLEVSVILKQLKWVKMTYTTLRYSTF